MIAQPPNDILSIMEQASQTYDVPLDLIKAVAYHESRYNPTAESKAGAIGVMQLMPINWKPYGITDPKDPYQNIMAGVKMLSKLYNKYNEWEKALAAYNWGPGNVNKTPNRDHWPKATKTYIQRVMEDANLPVPFSPSQSLTTSQKIRQWLCSRLCRER